MLLAGFLLLTRGKNNREEENFSSFAAMPSGEPPAPVINSTAPVAAPDYAAQADIYGQTGYGQQPTPAGAADQMYAPTQAFAAVPRPKSDPFAAIAPAPVAPAPAPAAVVQQIAPAPVQSGPPLPVTGLPEGWSMEQWSHYGAQYLAAQQGQPTAIQPASTDTPAASPVSDITGLLDDLDL